MDKRLMLAAVAGLLAAPPAGARVDVLARESTYAPPYRYTGSPPRRRRRDPTRLLLCGFPEIPCTEPDGYFWKRDRAGKQLYRLYRKP